MKFYFVKLFCSLLLALCLVGGISKADTPKLTVGSSAPALSVSTWWADNELPELEKGKIYVIDFWASWCGPCRESMPHILGLRKKYNDSSIQFAGISIDRNADDAAEYLTKNKIEMSMFYGIDDKEIMWKSWVNAAGRTTIPTTFIIDRNGKIAWIGHPMEGLEKQLLKVINQ